MDVLSDEHEREEVVRKWWHEHWKPITLGIVITLAGMVGVKQYQAWQLEQQQQYAFSVYTLQNGLRSGGVNAVPDAKAFIKEHKDVFGAVLSLEVARVQINAGNYKEAAEHVNFARTAGGDLISPQAALVEARLKTELKDYDGALSVLSSVKSDAYKAEVAALRGDVLAAKGDAKGARAAYAEAVDLTVKAGLQISPLLQMKFDDLTEPGDRPAYKVMEEQAAKLLEAAPTISGK